MQLIRETKYMQRFNIAVPEGAQMVLLQEEKFKVGTRGGGGGGSLPGGEG